MTCAPTLHALASPHFLQKHCTTLLSTCSQSIPGHAWPDHVAPGCQSLRDGAAHSRACMPRRTVLTARRRAPRLPGNHERDWPNTGARTLLSCTLPAAPSAAGASAKRLCVSRSGVSRAAQATASTPCSRARTPARPLRAPALDGCTAAISRRASFAQLGPADAQCAPCAGGECGAHPGPCASHWAGSRETCAPHDAEAAPRLVLAIMAASAAAPALPASGTCRHWQGVS